MHPFIKAVVTTGLLITLANLAACSHANGAAESRARAFVRALVLEPDNREGLRNVSLLGPQQTPDELLDGVLARVAIDYLRAKQRQGVTLVFVSGPVTNVDARNKIVTVVARIGDAPSAQSQVQLRVQMEDTPDQGWLVRKLQGHS